MIKFLDEETVQSLKNAIFLLEIYKIVYDMGYRFDPVFINMVSDNHYDMQYFIENGENLISIICEGNYYCNEIDGTEDYIVNNEIEIDLEFYKNEELALYEYTLNIPIVDKYIKYCEDHNINIFEDKEFIEKVNKVADSSIYDDYDYNTTFFSKNRKKILYISTSCYYISYQPDFVIGVENLFNYCKKKMEVMK